MCTDYNDETTEWLENELAEIEKFCKENPTLAKYYDFDLNKIPEILKNRAENGEYIS